MLIKSAAQKLTKLFKTANRRLTALASKFGKNSNVVKNAIGNLETSDLEKYFHQTKSGNYRFQTQTIISDLKNDPTGENHQVLERILNAVGMKEGKSGYLRKTKDGMKIPTVTEVKRKWQTSLDPDHELSDQEYYDLIEEAEELEAGSDYNSAYYDLKNLAGKVAADEIYQDILGRKLSGNLSDKEKQELKKGLIGQIAIFESKEKKKQKAAAAKQFGKVKKFGKKG